MADTYSGAPKQDKLTASELAEQYGWASAVLNSNKELASLFQQAVAGQWSPERFTAKLRGTAWFKNSSEKWRQTEVLRTTDPKSYQSQWEQARSTVLSAAAAMGSNISGGRLTDVVNTFYRQGWDENQLRTALAKYVSVKDGVLKGEAGQSAQALRALAYQNGMRYNDDWYTKAAQAVVAGTRSVEDFGMDIRTQAASAFPVFAEQIKAGQNVADVASPYRQSMAALLEMNAEDIDLFDPTIRSALSGVDPKTGTAQAKSLWQFENDLRQDARWAQTNNARETTMNTAKSILDAFGFGG